VTAGAAGPAAKRHGEHTPNLANGVCTKCYAQAHLSFDRERWEYGAWTCPASACAGVVVGGGNATRAKGGDHG
jgi:hypothetical protein